MDRTPSCNQQRYGAPSNVGLSGDSLITVQRYSFQGGMMWKFNVLMCISCVCVCVCAWRQLVFEDSKFQVKWMNLGSGFLQNVVLSLLRDPKKPMIQFDDIFADRLKPSTTKPKWSEFHDQWPSNFLRYHATCWTFKRLLDWYWCGFWSSCSLRTNDPPSH